MSQQVVASQQIVWDQAILNKYNYSGPRYTSYPTALEFHEAFTIADYDMACTEYPDRPLSLYIHIPFCHKLCYYCGCNKVITRHAHKADEYLDVLEQEILTRASLLQGRKVTQLHFGGGTPTFLSKTQISRLMNILRAEFSFEASAEISIEVDPREIELDMLDHLREEGFNRLSIGVQDFNKEVQKLVNREQDEEFIFAMVERAKVLGFRSTNLDLIYGLPKQTKARFAETLNRVLEMQPGRLSIFNYAHMPQLFAAQRKIKDEDLPQAEEKMAILQDTIATLTNAGYQFIGMDHFAKPDDELAVAQREGILHRNFQGYTTQGECDLVGFGVSAISMIGDAYAQNQKELKKYYSQVNEHRHALWKGVALDSDDLLRREVIKQLICNFKLDKAAVEVEFDIQFSQYFKEDLELLQTFIDDELVEVDDKEIRVTLRGRLLIRNICMCFDKYLRAKARQQQFSRVI
ncbi:oxygen-independent coproporphyrinogen III oxidase [Vibrio sp. Isolate23]|uniref:oxygen-independent coproporphyrinogen III oxidase n=1 Tax=Vibrio sp. Isolate23 TaxID=2908533 RepID=UPI001EFE5C9A|nr:oxygen-independent coproporphyrinogen III oxidase [Vibrio sp. Isolate23]MCG9684779.1 oxygen-independent coproporphyrinogen III oxidase [Vibrio sp. Isolate23]